MSRRTILPVLMTLLFSLVPMQASAAAPILWIEGVADHITVDVGVTVTLSSSDGAIIYRYDDSACSVNGQNRGTGEPTAVSNSPKTLWYQAYNEAAPEEKSQCLSVTWQEPVAPVLTINGGTFDILAESNESVTVTTEVGASIFKFHDTACTVLAGAASLPSTSNTEAYPGPATYFYKAMWDDSRTGVSICLGVQWKEEYVPPPTPPMLWLNGGSTDVTVQSFTDVEVTTETGAILLRYFSSSCEVVPGVIEAESTTVGAGISGPISYSFKAAWSADRSVTSECLTINWLKAGPMLYLNGTSTDETVNAGDSIHFKTETGAEVVTYSSLDCSGTETGRFTLETTDTQTTATAYSATAFWAGESSGGRNCYVATWEEVPEPEPVTPPSLTLNGNPVDLTVGLGETITFESDFGTHLTAYATLDCSGHSLTTWALPLAMTNTLPETFSAQADDGSLVSACRVATWDGVPRTDPPPLTLNGIAGDIEVDIDESVTFESITGATILTFPNADCTYPQRPSAISPVVETLTAPGDVSAIASFGGLYSPCYAASWIDPSVPEDGTVTSTAESSPTATKVATASPDATSTSTSEAGEKQTTVRVEMWDESSIAGAEWRLYAPVASQFQVDPYLTGQLETGNLTVFIDLPGGDYRFVLEPPDMTEQAYLITVSNESEEIVLQVQEPVNDEATKTSPGPTSNAEPDPASVTGLPSTGSGPGAGSMLMILAGAMAATLLCVAVGSRRSTV